MLQSEYMTQVNLTPVYLEETIQSDWYLEKNLNSLERSDGGFSYTAGDAAGNKLLSKERYRINNSVLLFALRHRNRGRERKDRYGFNRSSSSSSFTPPFTNLCTVEVKRRRRRRNEEKRIILCVINQDLVLV